MGFMFEKLDVYKKGRKFVNKILKEKDSHLLSVLFYDLGNRGWVEIKRDKKDERRSYAEIPESL